MFEKIRVEVANNFKLISSERKCTGTGIFSLSKSYLTNGNNINAEGVLVVVGVAVDVVADELLAVHILDGDHGLEELHQLLGIGLCGKVKVQALVVGLDPHTVLQQVNIYLYYNNQSTKTA